jgi:hypothetical protein
LKEDKEFKENKGQKEMLVPREHKDLKGIKELKEDKEFKGNKGQKEIQDQRGK